MYPNIKTPMKSPDSNCLCHLPLNDIDRDPGKGQEHQEVIPTMAMTGGMQATAGITIAVTTDINFFLHNFQSIHAISFNVVHI